jgi:hypothetical protein
MEKSFEAWRLKCLLIQNLINLFSSIEVSENFGISMFILFFMIFMFFRVVVDLLALILLDLKLNHRSTELDWL